MIRITKYFYIHILTVLLFVYCYITRRLEILAMSYAIMLVHELFHLAAALWIGLKPAHITLYPFGVNLRLKNRIVYGLADEIILYLAGPLSNILMALLAMLFRPQWQDFYRMNLCLFILNMLPVLPLDGGVVLKKILMHRLGQRRAERILCWISWCMIAALSALGVWIAIKNQFQFSICFFVIFLLGNIFTAKEKYNIDFVKELMFYQEKGRKFRNKQVKTVMLRKGDSPRTLAQSFTAGQYYIIFVVTPEGKIDDILTETQLMQYILSNSGEKSTKYCKIFCRQKPDNAI